VERAHQRALIETWLAGPEGCLLAIVGEPGSGKTALLQDAVDQGRELLPLVVTARPSEAVVPFALLRRIAAALPDGAALAGHVTALAESGPAESLSEHHADVRGTADRLVAALDGRLLALDDAHWVDAISLEVIGVAARRSRVVLASRPWSAQRHRDVAAAVAAVDARVLVETAPLAVDGVHAMLRTADPSATRRQAEEVHRVTDGMPLMVEALGRRDAATLREYVTAELLRVGATAAQAARAIAALAGTATHADLAELVGVEATTVPRMLEELSRSDLLRAGALRLRHPLLEEIVLSIDGDQVRAATFARAARRRQAQAHDRTELVRLLMQAAPLGEVWAEEALLQAGHEALAAFDPEAAVALAERALAERAADAACWAEATSLLARARLLTNDTASALEHAEAALLALDRAGASRPVAEVRATLVQTAMLAGDQSRALRHASLLRDDLESGDAHWRTSALAAYLGATFLVPSMGAERLAMLEAHDDLVSARTDRAIPLAAYAASALASAGRDAEARAMLDRVPPSAFDAPDRLVSAGIAAVASFQLEDLEQARWMFARIAATSRVAGVRTVTDGALLWLGRIAIEQGDWRTGAQRGVEALASSDLWPTLRAWAHHAVISTALLQGDPATIRGACAAAEGDALAVAAPEGPGVSDMRTAQSEAALARQDPVAAVRWADLAEEAYPLSDLMAPWRPARVLASVHLPGGPRPDDLEALRADVEGTRPRLAVLAGLALARAEPQDALEHLDRAHTAADDLDAPILQVRALVEHGAALRRAGERTAARGQLQDARRLAALQGLVALERSATAELRAAGGRVRPGTDDLGLTAAERRVAELIATGASNRQVAAALTLSVRTVETHMSRVLRKTGSSREELSALLAPLAPGADG
jgi:DNA-binding CsgD family transcriptional regulator